MKNIMLILLACGLVTSCTSLTIADREFFVAGAENEAAWSRANAAVFEDWSYNFLGSNDYILYSPSSGLSVWRAHAGGNRYVYRIKYKVRTMTRDDEVRVHRRAEILEYRIRNVEPPRSEHSESDARPVDQPVIKAPKDRPAKKREVRPGVYVWE